MSPLERTLKTIDFEKPDRCPVAAPIVLQHAMRLKKVKPKIFCTNPTILAETLLFAWERYRYDGIYVSSDNHILSEAMGSELIFPDDTYPVERRPFLTDYKNLNKLKVPNPYKNGRMPVILRATQIISERLGKNFFIETCIDSGPFGLACTLRNINSFLIDLYDNPSKALDLLDLCTQTVKVYGIAIAKSGAHAIQFGDSAASLISREFYKKFVLPFEQEVFREISKLGVKTILHICGDSTHILEEMASSGADCLEIDHRVDIGYAKRRVGNRVCLKGNLAPSRLLLQGTSEQVYREAKKCIKIANGNGGFILNPGCEVPADTPSENILAMVKAATESESKG